MGLLQKISTFTNYRRAAKFIRKTQKVLNSSDSNNLGKKAFIQNTDKYICYNYATTEPVNVIKVWVSKLTNKIKYFEESNNIVNRVVKFDDNGDILHIRYDKEHPKRTLKSIFYGSGKREVTKN